MIKKNYLWTVVIFTVLGLVLAGCSKQSAASASASTTGQGTTGDRQSQMPESMQLALGTLGLEGTDQAVTAEQAATLLPLWRAAKSLTGADNVAPEELNAVFKQIKEAMTADQMIAIQAMDLSGGIMRDLADKYGVELPGGGFSDLTPEQQATMEAARASGQAPQGFGPGGGGPPPDGGEFFPGGGEGGPPGANRQGSSSSGSNSNNGSTNQRRAGGGFGAAFYQAVINLLEKKAG